MPAETPDTPCSGLLLRLEPILSPQQQYSPEHDGSDSHSYGHGQGMADWLRRLPVARTE
jgi:hypothetical protein